MDLKDTIIIKVNMLPKTFLHSSSEFKDFSKQIIEILPDGNGNDFKPGSVVRFSLPPGSTLNLNNMALHLTAKIPHVAQHLGTAGTHASASAPTGKTDTYNIYPPKYIASLINQITIYCNGQIVQQISEYNQIVNILTDMSKTNNKSKILSYGNGFHRNDYRSGSTSHQEDYIITDWFGILGSAETKEVSGSIIDTNMLGNCVLEFQFAKNNVLARSSPTGQDVAVTPFFDADQLAESLNEVGFSLENLKLSVERMTLSKPQYDSMDSILKSGGYEIMFNHYTIFKGNGGNTAGNMRVSVNSQSIKYVLGYFENGTKNNSNHPMELDEATKTSGYFTRKGADFVNAQFIVGSTPMPVNPMKITDTYLNTLRLRGDKSSTDKEYFENLDTMEKWQSSFLTVPLSLEYSEDWKAELKSDSGLSTENMPLNITFNYNLTSANSDTPCMLVVSNRVLKIKDGVSLSVDI